ncbi:MAG: TOBE domain-containing protein [Bacilli bacterium]|nr:TOBE domain-containing protein [Bacilli bacterium]
MLFNLISSLDKSTLEIINITDEEVHSLLDINDIDSLEVKLNSILREYLFAKEKEFNPIIEDLLGKLNKLEEQIKKEEKEIILGIRPEHIVESKDKESFKCKITLTELLGSEYFVHLDFPTKELLANIDAVKNIKVGDVMSFSLRNDCIHTFDPITKNRI